MKIILASLVLSLSAFAIPVAIIDSGVDVEHKDLLQNIWTNAKEIPNNNRDEDRNGYQDDFYGWNFAENNSEVIDRSYIGTFSDTPKKFFAIQLKMMLGTATPAEIQWVKDIRNDQEVIKELQKFGNFVHGTHVAGIAVKGRDANKILSVKLIPTEVKLPFSVIKEIEATQSRDWKVKLLKQGLKVLAEQQTNMLQEIAFYVGAHGSLVANGSFGTGTPQVNMIVKAVFNNIFKREPTEEELRDVGQFFITHLLVGAEKMISRAPNTLFVFAAGNDGLNNDENKISPANARGKNTMTVAATYQNQFLAPFSNYGDKMVDVAAPGMGVNSQIPGDDYLVVSGTSQAAPLVAGIAGEIRAVNPNLSVSEVKRIIMETVDKKGFLSGKVKTGGIVNDIRAVEAAQLSLTMDLDAAIKSAKSLIGERVYPSLRSELSQSVLLPLFNPIR